MKYRQNKDAENSKLYNLFTFLKNFREEQVFILSN